MLPFTIHSGIAAPMPLANVTTDAMAPTVSGRSTSVDLGKLLFAEWRYLPDGSERPDFVLNRPAFRGATILVTGPNFGCGSSRERAVWALMRFGVRCVIAPDFADIFRENAYQNGLLPVTLDRMVCDGLLACLELAPAAVTVDLERSLVRAPNGSEIPFSIPAERRATLLQGLEEIDVILKMEPDIAAFEQRDRVARPWIYNMSRT